MKQTALLFSAAAALLLLVGCLDVGKAPTASLPVPADDAPVVAGTAETVDLELAVAAALAHERSIEVRLDQARREAGRFDESRIEPAIFEPAASQARIRLAILEDEHQAAVTARKRAEQTRAGSLMSVP